METRQANDSKQVQSYRQLARHQTPERGVVHFRRRVAYYPERKLNKRRTVTLKKQIPLSC
jgi:hypothetical protein